MCPCSTLLLRQVKVRPCYVRLVFLVGRDVALAGQGRPAGYSTHYWLASEQRPPARAADPSRLPKPFGPSRHSLPVTPALPVAVLPGARPGVRPLAWLSSRCPSMAVADAEYALWVHGQLLGPLCHNRAYHGTISWDSGRGGSPS